MQFQVLAKIYTLTVTVYSLYSVFRKFCCLCVFASVMESSCIVSSLRDTGVQGGDFPACSHVTGQSAFQSGKQLQGELHWGLEFSSLSCYEDRAMLVFNS